MEQLLERYTPSQKATIASFFTKLAMATNKTGKMLESKKTKIMRSWEAYEPEVVIDALNVYIGMDIPGASYGKGKNEKYVLGIMRNKAAGGVAHGRANADRRGDGEIRPSAEDEGERLRQFIKDRAPESSELECDF